jgi:hypothetical protein
MRTHRILALAFILIAGIVLVVTPTAAGPISMSFIGVIGENKNGDYP